MRRSNWFAVPGHPMTEIFPDFPSRTESDPLKHTGSGSHRIEPFNIRDRTTAELLSLIAGKPVKDAPDLRELSRMTSHELSNRLGIDRDGTERLQAALELASRSRPLTNTTNVLKDDRAVSDYFRERLQNHQKESFWVLTLDQRHRPIDCHRISEGSLTMTLVHPREAFAPALRDSAAAVIFVHNHPSGNPDPSPDDRELTERLLECGNLLGIRVVDHLVVGSEGHYSFRSQRERENARGSLAAEPHTSTIPGPMERTDQAMEPERDFIPESKHSRRDPVSVMARERYPSLLLPDQDKMNPHQPDFSGQLFLDGKPYKAEVWTRENTLQITLSRNRQVTGTVLLNRHPDGHFEGKIRIQREDGTSIGSRIEARLSKQGLSIRTEKPERELKPEKTRIRIQGMSR